MHATEYLKYSRNRARSGCGSCDSVMNVFRLHDTQRVIVSCVSHSGERAFSLRCQHERQHEGGEGRGNSATGRQQAELGVSRSSKQSSSKEEVLAHLPTTSMQGPMAVHWTAYFNAGSPPCYA